MGAAVCCGRAPPSLAIPPIAQTWHWIRRPFDVLEACQARFGDIFTVRIVGFGDVVVVADPEAVREIFAGGPGELNAGESNAVLRPFLGQHSVIVLDGERHQRQRRLLLPLFHGERMQAYGDVMLALSNAAIDEWPLGTRFPLHRRLQRITLQVILRTVFGLRGGARFRDFSGIVEQALDLAASPLLLFPPLQQDLGPLTPWGRFQRLVARLDETLFAELRQRRAQPAEGESDILSLLLSARDEADQPMTDAEIRDELVTLLVAGHETTATALSWALRFVLDDEPLRRRLLAEIEGAQEGGALRPERLARLELLDATVKEALRLRPVIPLVGRVLRRPLRALGHDLPPGTIVAPSVYLVHRRPELYPEPRRFDPDRFLRFRPGPAEYFPFGGGARRCVGAAFATYEMKMVLGAVLWRTSLHLAPGYRERPVRRSITLTPAKGLPVVLTARRRTFA